MSFGKIDAFPSRLETAVKHTYRISPLPMFHPRLTMIWHWFISSNC
jgi:hypothetical protein